MKAVVHEVGILKFFSTGVMVTVQQLEIWSGNLGFITQFRKLLEVLFCQFLKLDKNYEKTVLYFLVSDDGLWWINYMNSEI